jgi:hypothetical protein
MLLPLASQLKVKIFDNQQTGEFGGEVNRYGVHCISPLRDYVQRFCPITSSTFEFSG